jgi:hypothetical protein
VGFIPKTSKWSDIFKKNTRRRTIWIEAVKNPATSLAEKTIRTNLDVHQEEPQAKSDEVVRTPLRENSQKVKATAVNNMHVFKRLHLQKRPSLKCYSVIGILKVD